MTLGVQLLDCYALSNAAANRDFLMTTQDRIVGGFAKWPDNGPGIYISFKN